MKVQKNVKNDDVLNALSGSKGVYSDILTYTLNTYLQDDITYSRYANVLSNVANLSQLDKDILYLYAIHGATETARLLQVSRQYVSRCVKEIKDKIRDTAQKY